jgi:hypothetical protein
MVWASWMMSSWGWGGEGVGGEGVGGGARMGGVLRPSGGARCANLEPRAAA